jgi:hypothetical protein
MQVYRVLSFVMPTALLTAIGMIAILNWLAKRIAYRPLALGVFAILRAFSLFMLYNTLNS